MKHIFILSLSLFVSFCFGQQKKLDSLLEKLKAHPAEDSLRFELLDDIAESYSFLNPQKGLIVAEEQINLANKLNSSIMLAKGYLQKGLNLSANGNNEDAIVLYKKAVDMFNTGNAKKYKANAYKKMGIAYFNIGDYKTSINCHQNALAIYKKEGDSLAMAHVFNSLGVDYMYLADYPRALQYYNTAKKIYENLGQKKYEALPLGNIGIVYRELSEYSKALEIQRQVLAINQQIDDQQAVAGTLGNIGTLYDEIDSLSTALIYFTKSYELYKTIGNAGGIGRGLCNLGLINKELKNYAAAKNYFTLAIDQLRSINDKANLTTALSSLADLYVAAPVENGRLSKAEGYLNEALSISKAIGHMEKEMYVWRSMSDLYEKQKRFDKAYDAYKQFTIIRDSIVNDSVKNAITKAEMQFAFEKKEALLKADHDKQETIASAQIKRQRIIRNATFAGTVVILLAAIAVFAFYKRRQGALQQKKEAEVKVQVAETEMKALRSQMNPHFIFNSLNSIGDYISKNDISSANYYLGKFARVMRMILENSEQKEISLADDLKVLELYMQLEATRMNDKFIYEIKVDKDIDAENTLIPPLILQPFVENSIWHGIAQKEGIGKIFIHIHRNDEMLFCVVEDNGVGLDNEAVVTEERAGEKRSLGMKITKARLELLNRFKKKNASMELTNLVEGVRVEVQLPLELSF